MDDKTTFWCTIIGCVISGIGVTIYNLIREKKEQKKMIEQLQLTFETLEKVEV